MTRRARRMRPATPAEQEQLREFTARVGEVLDAATLDARWKAYTRMRRVADRILSAGRVDAARDRSPSTAEQVRNP